MEAPRLEVAEVFRGYQDDYLARHPASREQRRVIRDLARCRTAALGAHCRRCDACGHEEIAYNSCRNRHCPKCQARKQAEWLDAQRAKLLEVPYYHVVFTLPEELGPLALQNQRLLYGFLFRAAAETLLAVARDPKHLGARIGFTAVLHTWGQSLLHHPHVHCVVPGGGLSEDGDRWIPTRDGFFLPVRVLSRLFRGKYLAFLRQAYEKGELVFAGRLTELADRNAWRAFLRPLYETEWVVYAKPPFGSPELVLKYLARYTHRVAISNRRLLSLEDDHISFRYKDYRHGGKDRVMRLTADEFMRRFLLHVLPAAFVRIRHFGLLANRSCAGNLARCQELLGTPTDSTLPEDGGQPSHGHPAKPCDRCPACRTGILIFAGILPPSRAGPPFSIALSWYA